ncbi:hypothetical protein PQU96_13610 [Vogesella sp. LYT5W]|uniref:Uncharacterized protein n=1 Tax=Vogesella margarita TaxID=2984199 RepID=A0ABT5IRH7_9NEIS|nr:hypothetical protein [Vogesella margarita]MDC7715149.1 hypothetical protein [Vogesella margarita]
MFTPNLPELIPQDFKGYQRVAFDDLTLSERHHLQRLGAEHLPQYSLDELAIYRCPEGITFFGPLEFVRGAA